MPGRCGRVSQPPRYAGLLSTGASATAILDVGRAQLRIDLSTIDQQIQGAALSTRTGTGQGTFAASVPARTHRVVLAVAEGSFAQRFDLWTLRRLSPAPPVLYRSPTLATVTDAQTQSASLAITNPADGFTTPATLELTSATLTDFAPGSRTTPDTATDAYLVVDLVARRPSHTFGDPTWGHFLSTLAPLPGTRLTFTPAAGQPVPATTAPSTTTGARASTTDGLFDQDYWFTVPASLTSGTLSVTAGPTSGVEYTGFGATGPPVPLALPATVTVPVAFPGPATTASQPTPPWVGKPLPQTGTGAGGATATTSAGAPAPASGGFPVWLAVLLVALAAAGLFAGSRLVRRRRAGPGPVLAGVTGAGSIGADLAPSPPPTDRAAPPMAPTAPPMAPTEPPEPSPTVVIAQLPPPLAGAGEPAVRVVGTVEVTGWDEPAERRAVLEELMAYLALHPEGGTTSERLAAPLDTTPKTVRNNLSRLRQVVGDEHLPDAVLTGGYRLLGVPTDWGRFCELIEQAKHAGGPEADRLLAEALSHVRGVPFARVPEGQYGWAFEELLVDQMTAAVVGAAHRLAERRLAAGDHTAGAAAARKGLLVSASELSLWADLVTALALSGDRTALRRVLAEAARVLEADEVAELAALAERVRSARRHGEGGPAPPEQEGP